MIVSAARSPKTKIAIAAGLGALALVLVAVVVLLRGGRTSGGQATPEALVRAAIDRAIAGDGDGLIALGGGERLFESTLRCDPDQARKTRAAMTDYDRTHFVEHLDAWQGLTIDVVGVTPVGDRDVMPAGTESESGCKTTIEMATQELRATVTVGNQDGEESHTELDFRAQVVDGLWYLDELPGPPAVGGLRELRRIKDEMCACKDAGCAQHVYDDFERFNKPLIADDTKSFSDEQHELVMQLMDCETSAIQGH